MQAAASNSLGRFYMKPHIILIVGLAALTLGFALGFSSSPINAAAAAQSGARQSTESANDSKAQLEQWLLPASFGNDERIGRVFSSLQQRVELRRKYELVEALRGLDAKDLAALVKHTESLSKGASFQLLPALLERWFEVDKASATAWMKTAKLDYNLSQLWAKADSEGALAHALASPDEQWGRTLVMQAMRALYGKDPVAKFARAQTFPVGELRDFAISDALATWAAKEPAAAFAAFEKNEFSGPRNDILVMLLINTATKDPDWTLAKITELLPTLKAGVLGNDLVRRIASQIAQENPKQSLEWLSGLPDEFRSAALVSAGKEWARKEPLAALAWCMEKGVELTRADWNGASNKGPSILGDIMEGAGKETFATLAALPPGAERDSLLECAFMESMWHTPQKELYADGDALAWSFYTQLPEDAQIAKAYLFGQKRVEFGI